MPSKPTADCEQAADSEPDSEGLGSPLVQLMKVSRHYKTKSGIVSALSDVTLSIERGERIALLGRSGSGKSTLLNLLGGLDRPTSGSIVVNSQSIGELKRDQMAAYRLSSVGIVFQAFNLIPTKTAVQNVELPFVFDGQSRSSRRRRSLEALEGVGLKERATHRPSEMSGGEQQRVAVARALVNKPSLLLADEPTGNLDSATAVEIMKRIVEHSNEHQTAVVLVTHDEELASQFADRIIRMSDGRLLA